MLRNRFVRSTLAALAAIFVTVGIVFAAWSATGSGNGGAAATVAQGITFTATTPTGSAATLYPGGSSGVYFTASNPNPYAVVITSITWGTPVSLNTTACPSSNFTLDAAAPTTGLAITIPANPQTGGFSIPTAVVDMSHGAPDGCQGVGVDVPMTALVGHQQ